MSANVATLRSFKYLSLAVLAFGAAGAGFLLSSSGAVHSEAKAAPAADPTPVAAVAFGHVDLNEGVLALSPLQPGRVAAVYFHENQRVKEGAVLLRLEDNPAKLHVREAEAALEAAQKQLAQAEKLPEEHQIKRDRELAVAQDKVKELQAMVKAEEGKVAELDLHEKTLAFEVSHARAEANVMRAKLEQARDTLEQCELKAPRAGRVLRVLVEPGEMTGGQPKQPAVQFWPDKEPLIVRAEVEQEFAAGVAEGQAAEVEDYYAAGGARWTGRVKRVSDWFTQRRTILDDPLQFKDVRTLECLIGDLKSDGKQPLRIGQRMRVTIRPAGKAGGEAVVQ
jgi:multidrug resistance efflux pump